MLQNPEQVLAGGGRLADQNGQHIILHLDPPIASSDWVLLRGQVQVPCTKPRFGWFFPHRKATGQSELNGATLEVRLPGEEEARGLTIGPDGSFEARLATNLPRLRSTQRQVLFTLRHRGQLIEQVAPLFTPRPGATIAVIVLTHGRAMSAVTGKATSSTTTSLPTEESLSECSRELTTLISSRSPLAEPGLVFYLGTGASGKMACPPGVAIDVSGQAAASAVAVEQAAWISRLMELFANELEFVIIADTDRRSMATFRALTRLGVSTQRLRAIFLNDTRPVARGVMLQAEMPSGIDGLELPIVMVRTLEEGRRAAVTYGLMANSESTAPSAPLPARRISATHARVTRHPLVFCHGMLGYSVIKLQSVDLENYFHGLRERLTERGFRVLMPELGRTHSIEQRAEQLRQAIGRWTSEPVNIIGHSMGGLDARFLITKLGLADRVVSLTTVATPHHGSYFADWFVERFDAKLPFLRGLERMGMEMDGFRNCTRAACRLFNQAVPDSPKVRYFSYSAFQVARKIPPVLRRSHSLIARVDGANDGLVSELSARWGEHVATLRADHLSLVGEHGPEYFDHLAFYTRIVDDLVRHGF